jgi:hypothetical protein
MDKFLAAYPDSHLAGEAKALRATLIARDETKPAAAGLPPRDLYKGEDGPQATVAPPPKTETGPGTLSEVPDPHVAVQPPNERPTITAPPIVPTPPNEPSVAPPLVPEPAATAAKRSPLLIGGVVAAVLAVVGVIAILNSSGPGQPETHSTTSSPAPSTTTSETPSKATNPTAAWLIQQGDSARAQGNIEQAISDYDMAQQVDPSSGGMEKAAELRQGQSSGGGGGGDNTAATANDQMAQKMQKNMQDMLNQLMNQNAPSPPETK